ncbi:phosphoribosyltransferase [Alkalicoccus chagannorensis]|uniref:phosphoribosyltransferase n=1 Tax=Alkalicoccus chagannorensis TaxID=427072 RepID=UPI00041C1165|nr:phosphoribosyltransferase [Alkalicoccus chagannorensis]
MIYRSYEDADTLLRQQLHRIRPMKPDTIVGIPRSGMIPAYMLGALLHAPVIDLQTFLENPEEGGRILLVDDCIGTGGSLRQVLEAIPANVHSRLRTCCLYSNQPERTDVDLFLEYLPRVAVYEWNIMHCFIVREAVFSLRALLTSMPKAAAAEKIEACCRYSRPKIIPAEPIHTLLCPLPEASRSSVEAWLAYYGIQVRQLVFQPEQKQSSKAGSWEAQVYRKSGAELFVAGSVEEAEAVFARSGRPVFSTEANRLFSRGILYTALRGSRTARHYVYSRVRNKAEALPGPVPASLKWLSRRVPWRAGAPR